MLSKLWQPFKSVVTRRLVAVDRYPVRIYSGLFPRTQYDVEFPKKLRLSHALRVNWELIPLVLITCTSLTFMALSIAWAINNKVDVVFTGENRTNISRTMDLRNPTIHKLVTINQLYEPWPEMQDVLDKMKAAEKRALSRLQSCDHS